MKLSEYKVFYDYDDLREVDSQYIWQIFPDDVNKFENLDEQKEISDALTCIGDEKVDSVQFKGVYLIKRNILEEYYTDVKLNYGCRLTKKQPRVTPKMGTLFALVKENKINNLSIEYSDLPFSDSATIDWQLLFEEACRQGHLKIARFLYEKENDSIDLHEELCAPLRAALAFKRHDVVVWLLSVGALSSECAPLYGGVEGVLCLLSEPTSYELFLKNKLLQLPENIE